MTAVRDNTAERQPVLEVEGLSTEIATTRGVLKPADEVSFVLRRGHATALVGESGSGKSVTAMSLMRLVRHPGRIVKGKVLLEGRNLLSLSEPQMQRVRGAQIAMVFQDPMTYLNPVFRIGDQLIEAVLLHQGGSSANAKRLVMDMLRAVHIPAPERVYDAFPHQLSGGMRQRVLIAMAISCRPKVIIADEPTTALDVTVQAQIMDLLCGLLSELDIALLLITHDLGLVAGYCDYVNVMYAGKIVESGPIVETFTNPRHPYTRALLSCSMSMDRAIDRFSFIPGQVPNLISPPHGCRFHPRCPHVMPVCRKEMPPLFHIGKQEGACWLNSEEAQDRFNSDSDRLDDPSESRTNISGRANPS